MSVSRISKKDLLNEMIQKATQSASVQMKGEAEAVSSKGGDFEKMVESQASALEKKSHCAEKAKPTKKEEVSKKEEPQKEEAKKAADSEGKVEAKPEETQAPVQAEKTESEPQKAKEETSDDAAVVKEAISESAPAAQVAAQTAYYEAAQAAALVEVKNAEVQAQIEIKDTAIEGQKTGAVSVSVSVKEASAKAVSTVAVELTKEELTKAPLLKAAKSVAKNKEVESHEEANAQEPILAETEEASKFIVEKKLAVQAHQNDRSEARFPVERQAEAQKNLPRADFVAQTAPSLLTEEKALDLRNLKNTDVKLQAAAKADAAAENGGQQNLPQASALSLKRAERILSSVAGERLQSDKSIQTQVSEALKASVDARKTEASIRLEPAEWGKIQVKLELHRSEINVSFLTEHAFVKDALERGMGQLRQSLNQEGLNLGQVNIGLNNGEAWKDNGANPDFSSNSAKENREAAESKLAAPAIARTRGAGSLLIDRLV